MVVSITIMIHDEDHYRDQDHYHDEDLHHNEDYYHDEDYYLDEDPHHNEDHHYLCTILRVQQLIVSKSYNLTGSCQPGQGGKEERSPRLLQADIEGVRRWCYQAMRKSLHFCQNTTFPSGNLVILKAYNDEVIK